jgi:hypothetical protein
MVEYYQKMVDSTWEELEKELGCEPNSDLETLLESFTKELRKKKIDNDKIKRIAILSKRHAKQKSALDLNIKLKEYGK